MPKVIDLEITQNGKVSHDKPVRTATRPHPRMVNRGPAGLLHKIKPAIKDGLVTEPVDKPGLTTIVAVNRIAEPLRPLAVPIDSVLPDPDNARIHPDRNMEAIRQSLATYGQVKPIVVRAATRVVVAGNGTLQAAKDLGWTEIAANVTEMSEVEAAGFGLVDNRTAELAKWDFEVMARIDKLLQEAAHPTIGWSDDELSVLRAAEWNTPTVSGDTFGSGGMGSDGDQQGTGGETLLVSFTPDQYEWVKKAVELMREFDREGGEGEKSVAECLVTMCELYIDD